MDATKAKTVTITRRSRIGFSWTNSPERWTDHRGQSHLRISDPSDTPSDTGFIRSVLTAYYDVARCNRGNDWSRRWFARDAGKWVQVDIDAYDLENLFDIDRATRRPWTDKIEAEVMQ